MELSCRLSGSSLHLLAYLFDAGYPDLAAELSRIRDDRVLRARAMVGRLADLGVGISWDQVAAIAGPAVVGRPHIARAMAASGAIASPREAFTRDWIGDGGRAYVGRYALDPVHAIRLVRDAGGVAVLAHPRRGAGLGNIRRGDRPAGRRRSGRGGGLPSRPAGYRTDQAARPGPRSRPGGYGRQ